MTITIGTKNKNKFEEIVKYLNIPTINFKQLPANIPEAPENSNTLEGNALQKAKFYYELLKTPVIADDTGLFVEALNGEPGVFSARYAGENATYKQNRIKLLEKLQEIDNRNAYFKTVICFYNGETKHFFEGITKGIITGKEKGQNGFGYDPVFLVPEFNKTYAEMSFDEKLKISHRSKALDKLKLFLKSSYLN